MNSLPRLRPWNGWMAAILIAGAVGVYFRLYPLTVFPQDLAMNNAQFLAVSQMRQAIVAQMDKKNPGIPGVEKTRRVNALLAKRIRETPKEFKQFVRQRAQPLIKNYQTDSHGGYLLEVDPYYYLRQTENILKTGRIASETRGREYRNPMTLAPAGYWYPMDLHPYLGAALYKAVSFFRPHVEIKAVVRWVPLFVMFLALGIFAAFCRRVTGITGWAGFMGMVYLMLCPMSLKRSLVGWYDTDPYNVLFPLAAILSLFVAFGAARTARARWTGALAAGAAFALHALFWRGWLIPYLVIFVFLLAGWLIPRSRRAADLSAGFYGALLLPVAVIPWVVLAAVWGPLGLQQEAAAGLEFLRGFLRPDFRPWPDVFITVGELNPMNFPRLAALLGGAVWVAVIVAGLALSFVRRLRAGGSASANSVPLLVLLGISSVGLLVSIHIQRFAILAAAPLAAAVPFAWVEWRQLLTASLPRIFAPQAALAIGRRFGLLWAAVTLAALVLLGVRAHAEIVRFYPIYNPGWDRMMTRLREETPNDAIVTSWWSPGHFLTSMGQRRVTFDGSSQNEPQAYWVANVFIESSERTALGILRMLDTSGNAAVDFLTERDFSLSDAVDLIKTIVPLSRQDARARLVRRFGESEADGLLDLTHGKNSPPPAYLFTYNHMIEQILALEFIGHWNFKKAEAFGSFARQQPNEVDRRLLSRATPQNTKLLWTMTEQPTYSQGEGYPVGAEGSMLVFSNGVRINVATRDAEIRGSSNPQANGRPTSVFWINDKNELIETPLSNPTSGTSVLLIDDTAGKNGGKTYRTVIMGKRLAGSVAMRLYYFGGRGLKFIRRVASEDTALYRTRLGLFEVDWEGYDRLLNSGKPAKN